MTHLTPFLTFLLASLFQIYHLFQAFAVILAIFTFLITRPSRGWDRNLLVASWNSQQQCLPVTQYIAYLTFHTSLNVLLSGRADMMVFLLFCSPLSLKWNTNFCATIDAKHPKLHHTLVWNSLTTTVIIKVTVSVLFILSWSIMYEKEIQVKSMWNIPNYITL